IAIVGRRPPPVRRPPPRRPTQVVINTAGGRATLRDGESQLTVGEGARPSTTLTVYRGSGQLRVGAQLVTVPEGFGARAEAGVRIAPVHRLPAAPAWSPPPTRLLLAPSPALDGTIAPGVAPPNEAAVPASAGWHVQLSRDETFTAIERDARLALADDHLSGELIPGGYFVRASAVDAERFEGPFGPVARVLAVSTALTPTAVPYQETLSLPAGVACTVDGEAVAAHAATTLDRLRPHTLRCAPEGEAAAAAEVTFERSPRAPYRVSAALEGADPVARRGTVRLRLNDQRDVAYAEERLAASARGGPVVAEGARVVDAATGEWLVPVRWSVGATAFSLHLALAADDAVDTADLALPRPPAPPLVEGFAQRLSLRAEGLYANMLSEYQRNADPSPTGAFMGNAKAITHGIAGSLRLGLDLRRPTPGTTGVVFGVELIGAGVVFPRDAGAPGTATLLGGGLRLTPSNGAVQPWVSAGAGVVLTGGLVRFGVEAGLGVDFRLSRALSLGPVVRYAQVVDLDDDPTVASLSEDARMLQVGVGLTLRLPRGR
ncbi:MAG: outer membrane protein OmpA, partial [Myxococcaceae bacterium]|nr:outer membrane protein OmpA [Myxococcaceae bacterium]